MGGEANEAVFMMALILGLYVIAVIAGFGVILGLKNAITASVVMISLMGALILLILLTLKPRPWEDSGMDSSWPGVWFLVRWWVVTACIVATAANWAAVARWFSRWFGWIREL
jgi:hypothetical protein